MLLPLMYSGKLFDACIHTMNSFGVLTWELIFEDNPYFYSNIKKLFYGSDFETSEYCKLTGFNIPAKVANGLRPVIPINLNNLVEWCDLFITHKEDVSKKNSIYSIMFSLTEMMRECWHEKPSIRPSFGDVVKKLQVLKLSLNK